MNGALAMPLDAWLSALHFVLAFALVAILAAQWALIRPGVAAAALRLAAHLDRGYGAAALLLLGAGFARVFYGAKGASFYLSNPVFWAKLALFAAAGLLSIVPTVQLIRWSRRLRDQPSFLPSDAHVRGVRRWLHAEAIVLALIPFAAAALARGIGYR
jgi:putative membrane protein